MDIYGERKCRIVHVLSLNGCFRVAAKLTKSLSWQDCWHPPLAIFTSSSGCQLNFFCFWLIQYPSTLHVVEIAKQTLKSLGLKSHRHVSCYCSTLIKSMAYENNLQQGLWIILTNPDIASRKPDYNWVQIYVINTLNTRFFGKLFGNLRLKYQKRSMTWHHYGNCIL